MKPLVVAFVFARGGSKGVPRKNLRPLMGKPLIAYSIEAGLQSTRIDRVIVSTEDSEIADVARRYGAEVPFARPEELAQDDSAEWPAWQHAVREIEPMLERPLDLFVSLPCTSPLRDLCDVDACVDQALGSDADITITVTPAASNPYFNMVRVDDSGSAYLVLDSSRVERRQDAPEVFEITAVAYAAKPSYVLGASGIFDGKVGTVIVPQPRSLDIDTEWDFLFAESVLQGRQEGRT